jgi:ATP-dependent RNA helicase SUPV3L1/SUV3
MRTNEIIKNAMETIRHKQPTTAFLENYPFIINTIEPLGDKKAIAIYESKTRYLYVYKQDLFKVEPFLKDLRNAKTKSQIKEEKKNRQYQNILNKQKDFFVNNLNGVKETLSKISKKENLLQENIDFLFKATKENIIFKNKEALLHFKNEQTESAILAEIENITFSEAFLNQISNESISFNRISKFQNTPSLFFSEDFEKSFQLALLEKKEILKYQKKIKFKILGQTVEANIRIKYGDSLIKDLTLEELIDLRPLYFRGIGDILIDENEINRYVETIFNRTTETLEILNEDKLLKKSFYQDFKEKIAKVKYNRAKFMFNLNDKNFNEGEIISKLTHSLLAQAFDVKEKRLVGFKNSMSRKIIRKNIEIDNFKSLFPNARNRQRKITFIQGETNSGKTYTAFEMAKEYNSGIYAAPLRLLALEGQQEFEKRGQLCSMLTGEERDEKEGANFVSSTVEMIDYSKEYDVAIIDEVQLINDPDRGHAWLEAIVGVNAKEVILVGAPDIKDVIVQVAKYLNEPIDIKTFERKTKIQFDKNLYRNSMETIGKLPPHSAVIAFSKKDVLALKSRFEKLGNNVSVIYGALPPQVRRIETERFVKGETDVVIATDAIGMGLNLPIENIFFHKIEKFNGREIVPLEAALVKQIVGRAGRYKKFDIGYVSALSNQSFEFIKTEFYKDTTVNERQFKCSPNYAIINQVHELTKEESISKLLQNYNNAIKFDFEIKNHMNEYSYMIGRFIDEVTLERNESLSLYEKVKLVNAPISMDRGFKVFDYYKDCINNILMLRKNLEIHPISVAFKHIEDLKSETQNQTELSIKKIDILSWLSFNFEEFSCLQNDIFNKRVELNKELISYLREA